MVRFTVTLLALMPLLVAAAGDPDAGEQKIRSLCGLSRTGWQQHGAGLAEDCRSA